MRGRIVDYFLNDPDGQRNSAGGSKGSKGSNIHTDYRVYRWRLSRETEKGVAR